MSTVIVDRTPNRHGIGGIARAARLRNEKPVALEPDVQSDRPTAWRRKSGVNCASARTTPTRSPRPAKIGTVSGEELTYAKTVLRRKMKVCPEFLRPVRCVLAINTERMVGTSTPDRFVRRI